MKSPICRFFLLSAFFVVLATAFFACSGIKVHQVNSMDRRTRTESGFFYSLPRTVLTVEIEEVTTTQKPGPYADYAEPLLGIEPIKEERTHTRTGEVNVVHNHEPDPECLYMVQVKNRNPFVRQKAGVQLNEQGVVQSVNASSTNNSAVAGASLLETGVKASGPGGALAFMRGSATASTDPFKYLESEKKLAQSKKEQARLLAEEIAELRERKTAIITGKTRMVDREAMEYAVDKIEELEKEYTNAFRGTVSRSSRVYRKRIIPDGDRNKQEVVLEDANLVIRLKKKPKTPADLIAQRFTTPSDSKDQGLFYRIPGMAQLTIEKNGQVIHREEIIVAQYGTLMTLPPRTAAMRTGYKIDFYETTGAVRSVSNTSEGLTRGQFNQMNAAMQGVLMQDNELQQLQRERMMLEHQLKIEELRKQKTQRSQREESN